MMWTNLAQVIASEAGSTVSYTDSAASFSARRFYRIKEQP